MKVLLAEDSRTNQILVKAYIEDAGHEIVIAQDGQQAVELFKDVQPDLVLMDMIMPVMDGIQSAIEIKKICDREDEWRPIIFLSAVSDAKDIVRAIEAGGDDYLIKPVDAVVLNAKLHAMERIAEMRQKLKKANRELRMMAVRDGLTGIANRRFFDETLTKEIKRAIRLKTPLSLIICDIDFFKPYNDNYGHQSGDDCLKVVARTMAKLSQRPGDVVARYGGEEFGIILPETTTEGALLVAETLRSTIEGLELTHKFSAVSEYITISAGVATITPVINMGELEQMAKSLIEEADIALYNAKAQGRNQVVAESHSLTP